MIPAGVPRLNGQQAACEPAGITPGHDHVSEGSEAASPQAHALREPVRRESRFVIDAAGFDLRPDPLRADAPKAFVSALRDYWIWAGQPSYRKLAQRAGGTPAASTICTMLSSSSLPTFDCMLAFLTACGATDEYCRSFATAWRRISFSRGDGAGNQQIPASRGHAGGLPDHQD
jgi:hypothetical protein